jgi:hypothetical protein
MSTVVDPPPLPSPSPPPSAASSPTPSAGWSPDRRFLGLAIVVDVVAMTLAYIAVTVPVGGPQLTRDEVTRYWLVAVGGALIVAVGMIYVIVRTLRLRRMHPDQLDSPQKATTAERGRSFIPRSLRFEITSRRTKVIGCVISVAAVPLALVLGVPLWLAWLAVLAPWIAPVAREARWKYARYGVFVLFALMGLLQMLHVVEHSVQVGQLVATTGDLGRSHGLFGQLDFELVHFLTDSLLWVGLGLLIMVMRGRNAWLWVAFVAASLHEVEHLYLFFLNFFANNVYLSGGFSGIMGHHGMIGSPLDRPYLHYTYNLIVFVPMLIAIWDEARHTDRLHPPAAQAAP